MKHLFHPAVHRGLTADPSGPHLFDRAVFDALGRSVSNNTIRYIVGEFSNVPLKELKKRYKACPDTWYRQHLRIALICRNAVLSVQLTEHIREKIIKKIGGFRVSMQFMETAINRWQDVSTGALQEIAEEKRRHYAAINESPLTEGEVIDKFQAQVAAAFREYRPTDEDLMAANKSVSEEEVLIKEQPVPTGRVYGSVEEMVKGEGVSEEVQQIMKEQETIPEITPECRLAVYYALGFFRSFSDIEHDVFVMSEYTMNQMRSELNALTEAYPNPGPRAIQVKTAIAVREWAALQVPAKQAADEVSQETGGTDTSSATELWRWNSLSESSFAGVRFDEKGCMVQFCFRDHTDPCESFQWKPLQITGENLKRFPDQKICSLTANEVEYLWIKTGRKAVVQKLTSCGKWISLIKGEAVWHASGFYRLKTPAEILREVKDPYAPIKDLNLFWNLPVTSFSDIRVDHQGRWCWQCAEGYRPLRPQEIKDRSVYRKNPVIEVWDGEGWVVAENQENFLSHIYCRIQEPEKQEIYSVQDFAKQISEIICGSSSVPMGEVLQRAREIMANETLR